MCAKSGPERAVHAFTHTNHRGLHNQGAPQARRLPDLWKPARARQAFGDGFGRPPDRSFCPPPAACGSSLLCMGLSSIVNGRKLGVFPYSARDDNISTLPLVCRDMISPLESTAKASLARSKLESCAE